MAKAWLFLSCARRGFGAKVQVHLGIRRFHLVCVCMSIIYYPAALADSSLINFPLYYRILPQPLWVILGQPRFHLVRGVCLSLISFEVLQPLCGARGARRHPDGRPRAWRPRAYAPSWATSPATLGPPPRAGPCSRANTVDVTPGAIHDTNRQWWVKKDETD